MFFVFIFTAKSQELKKDIEILSQTFERVIDRKEAIIKSLVKDIEEAEEQYQMALRSHLQNIDRLIGTCHKCHKMLDMDGSILILGLKKMNSYLH